MENTPTAPAEAPKAPESVATPNTNTETTAAPQMPDMHGFTSNQLADMKKFFDNNGGFEAIKSRISNPTPAPKTEAPKAEEPKPAQPQAQAQPIQPQEPAEGFLSTNQIARLQYRQFLMSDKKYDGLHDYIEKGEFMKEMEDLGMRPVDAQGNVNDRIIRRFLDMKAQTLPAPAQTTPASSTTPTADYINVGETINSREDAIKVMTQPGHPMHNQALEYMRNSIFGTPVKPVENKPAENK